MSTIGTAKSPTSERAPIKRTKRSRPAIALRLLNASIEQCTKCPELREYCLGVARVKRRAFAACEYWGRPVPGFGDAHARLLIVGLAPAAHGANRTGRMFTGDRSGDFLYAALHRAGLANQPISTDVDDGLKLRDVYITAPLRCAPPNNKPTPAQLLNCSRWLDEELRIITPQVILCLGAIAWKAMVKYFKRRDVSQRPAAPPFSHGCEFVAGSVTLLGCYHVSQQNTFTGKLTPRMIDDVLSRARALMAAKAAHPRGR